MCRLHALNGYFGYEKISTNEFYKYQNEYDMIYREKFKLTTCKKI